jgi:DNA-binding CsgD family transcriptional regulator
MGENRQKMAFTLILSFILGSVLLDIISEWGKSSSTIHLSIEIFIALSVMLGIILLWFRNLFLKRQLIVSKAESNKWKEQNAHLIGGLSHAIDLQLEEWKLSPSEKEITLLLLKGLSLKEIAEIRGVAERTVRQQSVNVYHKSGLSGRAELSAYFLEDLLK